eukprot:jgi/Chrzof1/185/Cz01g06090.t1
MACTCMILVERWLSIFPGSEAVAAGARHARARGEMQLIWVWLEWGPGLLLRKLGHTSDMAVAARSWPAPVAPASGNPSAAVPAWATAAAGMAPPAASAPPAPPAPRAGTSHQPAAPREPYGQLRRLLGRLLACLAGGAAEAAGAANC